MLAAVSGSSPLRAEFLREFGDRSVRSVLDTLPTACAEPFQPRDDLWAALRAHIGTSCGAAVAARATAALAESGVLLTANHFGIDTFADSAQGTLLYALWMARRSGRSAFAVVLGFGSVSLNNLTYPMGLRLYELPESAESTPVRLPVFPNRVKHCTVAAAAPFDRPMVLRARRRLDSLGAEGVVSAGCADSTARVLDEDFAAPAVLAESTYREQAGAVNRRLWSRMFAPGTDAPGMVQVQVERVCADLLAGDLPSPASLVHRLLFDRKIREELLRDLDQVSGCWDLAALAARAAGQKPTAPTGTVFFWGTTPRRTRVPMAIQDDEDGLRLVGTDERHGATSVPLRPRELAAAVSDGRLLPSLFLCFALLAFARGLICLGGYHQADYLPRMQRAVTGCLRRAADDEAADRIDQVPTDVCLAGIQPAVNEAGPLALPAGPMEIQASGGFSSADLRSFEEVSVRQATVAALPDVFAHLVPMREWGPGWVRDIARENQVRLDEVVRVGRSGTRMTTV